MGKTKKIIVIAANVIVCVAIVIFLILSFSKIERGTWVLSYAQQHEAPYFVVAHGKDFDVSNLEDPMYAFSKQIDLTCEAKNGRLLLTDKTNGKTYEGSYELASISGGRFQSFDGATYTVVIDGIEGTAIINSGFDRTLFVYIDGYTLNFDGE